MRSPDASGTWLARRLQSGTRLPSGYDHPHDPSSSTPRTDAHAVSTATEYGIATRSTLRAADRVGTVFAGTGRSNEVVCGAAGHVVDGEHGEPSTNTLTGRQNRARAERSMHAQMSPPSDGPMTSPAALGKRLRDGPHVSSRTHYYSGDSDDPMRNGPSGITSTAEGTNYDVEMFGALASPVGSSSGKRSRSMWTHPGAGDKRDLCFRAATRRLHAATSTVSTTKRGSGQISHDSDL